ncbi:MAG: SMC-Scp complex subunit ScpB [Candidatus Harrisonbacteria bacterium]|nr:SMC-Scp complex subunit ScpB [Candidatus Harrisonbacteria bacterium]
MSEEKNIPAALEALLFIYGEPMSFSRISKALQVSAKEIEEAADELMAQLKERGSGLSIIKKDQTIQLVSAAQYSNLIEDLVKAELSEGLSPAALETLSIIAYSGPISRAQLDYVRGVNSSFTLRNLLLRGLIDRGTDPERKGSYRYSISFELMRHLGLERQENLPEFEKFQSAVKKLFVSEEEKEG